MEFLLPIITTGMILSVLKKSSSSASSNLNCFSQFKDVKMIQNVSFAKGSCNAFWPVLTNHSRKWEVPYKNLEGKYVNGNSARAFGVIRGDGERYHVGIDLYCNDQDDCVACEDGVIIATQGFLNITKALLLQTNSGIVCLYGEIEANSWEYFGVKIGSKVKKGQKICRIGKNNTGTQMLHFETYRKGTTKNSSWQVRTEPSSTILNPTKYLLNIAKKHEQKT